MRLPILPRLTAGSSSQGLVVPGPAAISCEEELMTNDSFFALAVGGVITLFFGTLLLFGGYRFFMFLLPIWGFIFGFGLGAQTIQALFGDAFLATVTSW